MPGIAITQATAPNTMRLCMSPAPSVPSTAPPRAALLYSPERRLCDVTPGYYVVPDPAEMRRGEDGGRAPAAVAGSGHSDDVQMTAPRARRAGQSRRPHSAVTPLAAAGIMFVNAFTSLVTLIPPMSMPEGALPCLYPSSW